MGEYKKVKASLDKSESDLAIALEERAEARLSLRSAEADRKRLELEWEEKEKAWKEKDNHSQGLLKGYGIQVRDHDRRMQAMQERVGSLEQQLEQEKDGVASKVKAAVEEFKNSSEGSAWLEATMAESLTEAARGIMSFADSEVKRFATSSSEAIDWSKHPHCALLLDVGEDQEEDEGEDGAPKVTESTLPVVAEDTVEAADPPEERRAVAPTVEATSQADAVGGTGEPPEITEAEIAALRSLFPDRV